MGANWAAARAKGDAVSVRAGPRHGGDTALMDARRDAFSAGAGVANCTPAASPRCGGKEPRRRSRTTFEAAGRGIPRRLRGTNADQSRQPRQRRCAGGHATNTGDSRSVPGRGGGEAGDARRGEGVVRTSSGVPKAPGGTVRGEGETRGGGRGGGCGASRGEFSGAQHRAGRAEGGVGGGARGATGVGVGGACLAENVKGAAANANAVGIEAGTRRCEERRARRRRGRTSRCGSIGARCAQTRRHHGGRPRRGRGSAERSTETRKSGTPRVVRRAGLVLSDDVYGGATRGSVERRGRTKGASLVHDSPRRTGFESGGTRSRAHRLRRDAGGAGERVSRVEQFPRWVGDSRR